jgi:hypothetical protein
MLGSWPCTEEIAAATITSNLALSSSSDAGRGRLDSWGHMSWELLVLLGDEVGEA